MRSTGWAQGDLGGDGDARSSAGAGRSSISPGRCCNQVHGARVVVVEGPGGADGEAADAAVTTVARGGAGRADGRLRPGGAGQPGRGARDRPRRLARTAGRRGRGDRHDDAPARRHPDRGGARPVHPPLLLPLRRRRTWHGMEARLGPQVRGHRSPRGTRPRSPRRGARRPALVRGDPRRRRRHLHQLLGRPLVVAPSRRPARRQATVVWRP